MSSHRRRGCPMHPLFLILLVAAVLVAAVGLFFAFFALPGLGGSSSADAPLSSVTQSLDPDLSPPPMSTETPGAHTPSTAPPPEETDEPSTPAQSAPAYDFTQPIPESEAAADDYFADAAFVGDSRTAGFMMYSGVPGGDGLTHTGLSIFDVAAGKACIKVGKETLTVQQALARKDYGKIYLCLGVNELGYNQDQKFYQDFCDLIDQLRADHPGAVIYLQTLIPLNEAVIAEKGGKEYLKNDHLREYNRLIAQAAADKQVPLLDVYSAFVDETGSLPADASNDGVHLNRSYCVQWLDYLKTHTVSHDTLYPEGANAA